VPLEDQLRTAVDRALAESSGQLERALRSFAAEVAQAAAAEQRSRDTETQRVLEAAKAAEQSRIDAAASQAAAQATAQTTAQVAMQTAAQETARVQRLTNAVRKLDAARSLGDLLDALSEGAAQEAERTALFITNQSRLQGWRFTGLDDSRAARSISLEGDEAGVLATLGREQAAMARIIANTDTLPALLRTGQPRHRAAIPVVVDGAIVAVLYADAAAGADFSDRWVSVLEVLTRHAGRALEVLTLQRVAGLSPIAPAPAAASPAVASAAGGPLQC